MEEKNGVILSVDEEERLLAPIDEYIGSIQQKVNALRVDGTDKVVSLTTHMAVVKENANYTKAEKAKILAEDRTKLEKAKAVEAANKAEIKAHDVLAVERELMTLTGTKVNITGDSRGKRPLQRRAGNAEAGA